MSVETVLIKAGYADVAKAIIQSGIREVIYLKDKYKQSDSVIASKKMMDLAGVTYTQLEIEMDALEINFDGNHKIK